MKITKNRDGNNFVRVSLKFKESLRKTYEVMNKKKKSKNLVIFS